MWVNLIGSIVVIQINAFNSYVSSLLNSQIIKQILVFLVKLTIAGGLFYWLFASDKLDFQPVLEEAFNSYHILGLIVVLGSTAMAAFRWGYLLKLQGLSFSGSVVIRWTLIGEFFGLTLPGGVGTELSRAFYMFRNATNTKTAALSSIILDRILAMSSLILMGFLAFLALLISSDTVDKTILVIGVILGAVLIATVLGFILIGFRPIRRLIQVPLPEKYRQVVDNIIVSYVSQKKILLKSFVYSFIAHSLILLAFFIAAEILSTGVSWEVLTITMPLVMISNILPFTPAGIGVGETTAAFLFALFGIPNGGAIMLVARIWLVAVQLLGGVVYLFDRHEEEVE